MARQAAQRPQSQPTSRQLSPAEQDRERDGRVLHKKKPPQVQSLAEAVVIKEEGLFLVSERDGHVPFEGAHGFGLYYHDCRFLNGYELRLDGRPANALTADAWQGAAAELELTNPGFQTAGGRAVQKEDVGIHWERVLDAGHLALHDCLTFRNYSQEEVTFPVRLAFRAAFEDLFVVRGMSGKGLGKLLPTEWKDGALCFLYEGSDGVFRSLQIHFDPAPATAEGTTAHFHLTLPARDSRAVNVTLVLRESVRRQDVQPRPPPPTDPKAVRDELDRSSDRWVASRTGVRSDSRLLEWIIDRSLRDLRMLRTHLQDHEFFAAGIPWYVALFGRDSIISAYQTLAYEPDVAAETLRLLARYQGTTVDAYRAEQPGKILHELRVGELTHKGAIPQTPYYGSIDSTPLFLILLGRHAAWTGDLGLFKELRGNVERALEWMERYGDRDGSGYLSYQNESDKGLDNQGWKDSGDSVVNADGSLAKPPIKLVEVQGYAYLARLSAAELFERAGDHGPARHLRQQARELRERFNRDFWLPDLGFYALALQADNRPAAVVSSNPGQALWTGIVAEERAAQVAKRLLADDMFNGWGVRTLSGRERRYNPISYHDGTVWPHDNSLILAGLRLSGQDEGARRVFGGITDAALHFHAYRLPEVFAGFKRSDFGVPVHYPVACHPQAWAAGAVPFMLATLLGLTPEGFDRRLRIVRPVLPDHVNRVELHGLRVGAARADLRFRRGAGGGTEVEVWSGKDKLDVKVER
jgi:glycogen debranching enzyme